MRLLLLAVLALAGSPIKAVGPVNEDQKCKVGPEFRVMTYNIRLDVEADQSNAWAYRRDLFISQVRLLGPSIFGAQEVVPGQYADLVRALPGYVAVGRGRDENGAGEASPLFIAKSQFRIAQSGMFWLSQTPDVPSIGWDAAFRRVATWAQLVRRSDGKRLLAINTHWDHLGKQARLNSAVQLRAWIETHRIGNEPVVLLGDLNAPVTEDSVAALTSPPAHMRDARGAAIEPGLGTTITFNGWNPIPASGETIDHILVGRGLGVLRYHALGETFDGRLASDHFPVIADLFFIRGSKDCAG